MTASQCGQGDRDFEQRQPKFLGHAARNGMIDDPKKFVSPVPHISLCGQEQVDLLRSRHKGMSAHHFRKIADTEDGRRSSSGRRCCWPGRQPIAATKVDGGTDVNFGTLSQMLVEWLGEQVGCGYATRHRG